MKRERLTPDRIRRFACPDGTHQAFLWDTIASRLAVRATARAKSFVFEAKLNRQTIRRTIGDVAAWNLDEARAEANRLQVMVESGTDPRELDRQREAEKVAAKASQEAAKVEAENRQRYTLRSLAEAYADHLEGKGKVRSAAAVRSSFKCHVFTHPEIADAPAREVTSHQVAALVRKVREAGKERAAGILRSYLSAAFNVAKRAPYDSDIPTNLIPFAIDRNPVDVIPVIKAKAGNRTLSVGEMHAYLAALGDDLADQALKLALYAGGQRMAQLLRATVSDWNPDTATLRLFDGKGRRTAPREHLLPLGIKGAEIVDSLIARAKERESETANDRSTPCSLAGLWLFSTHGRVAMTFETPGIRAGEISKGMNGEAFSMRDIRRTCETMLASMGISKDTRAQLLSHGLSGVQAAHYDRHSYTDEKRAALVAWEQRLDEIATGKKAANVVQMKQKRKASGN